MVFYVHLICVRKVFMKSLRFFASFLIGIVCVYNNGFSGIKKDLPSLTSMTYIPYYSENKKIDCFATMIGGEEIYFNALDTCKNLTKITCICEPTVFTCVEVLGKQALVFGTNEGSIGVKYIGEKPIAIVALQKKIRVCTIEKTDKQLLAGLSDGSLWDIDVVALKAKKLESRSLGKISLLRYIGNNTLLVAFSSGTVQVFDLEKNKWGHFTSFENSVIVGVEPFSDDNVLICLKSGYIMSWNFQKNAIEPVNHGAWPITAFFKWSKDLFAVGCANGSIYFYKVGSEDIFELPKQHEASIISLFRYKDMLVSASHDGIIKFWNVKNKECKKTVLSLDDSLKIVENKKNNDEIFDFEL